MSIFRHVKIVTDPPEFTYETSINPLVLFGEVERYFLGPKVHSRIGYDFEKQEEIETPYNVVQVQDLGLVSY